MNDIENPYEPPGVSTLVETRPGFLNILVPSGATLALLFGLAMLVDVVFLPRSPRTILSLIVPLSFGVCAGMTGYFWTSRIIPRSDGSRCSIAVSVLEAMTGVVLFVLAILLAIVLRDWALGGFLRDPQTTEWRKTLVTSVSLGGCYSIVYAILRKIFCRESRIGIHLVVLIPAVMAEFAILLGMLWIKTTSSPYFCVVTTLFFATLGHTNCFAWWLSFKKIAAEKYQDQRK